MCTQEFESFYRVRTHSVMRLCACVGKWKCASMYRCVGFVFNGANAGTVQFGPLSSSNSDATPSAGHLPSGHRWKIKTDTSMHALNRIEWIGRKCDFVILQNDYLLEIILRLWFFLISTVKSFNTNQWQWTDNATIVIIWLVANDYSFFQRELLQRYK